MALAQPTIPQARRCSRPVVLAAAGACRRWPAASLLLLAVRAPRAVGRRSMPIGIDVIFTWKAVVIAMMVISFPLVTRSVRAGHRAGSTAVTNRSPPRLAQAPSELFAPSRCRWRRAESSPAPSWGFSAGAPGAFAARDDHGGRRDSPAGRERLPSASTRWSKPGAKDCGVGPGGGRRAAGVRRDLRVEPIARRRRRAAS